MLISLLKIVIFFAVVVALTLGAIHLAENGQNLLLQYGGTEIVLTPVKAVIALLLLLVVAWLVVKLLGLLLAFFHFLAGDETAISRYFDRSRRKKGYDALGDAVLAIASGEGKLAQDKAARAAKYLPDRHITNLLSAQAAEVAGDDSRANQIYRRLLDDDRTRFVGIRGLMRQELNKGDTATALLLAQKAYAIKPRHKEIQNTLMELEMQEGDWKGARRMLREKQRQGEISKDVRIRRDAVLALQEASDVLAQGSSISAREAAISAAKASPDLIPAAVLAARSYLAQNDGRNAARLLEKTWSVNPHPDLAACYAEIAPNETPTERLSRFKRLIERNADNEELRLLKAELLLAAEDFPGARRALGDLAETHPTVRTLSIMAAVERGEGADDSVVRGWLARALTASRGPQWCCDKCQNVMSDWAPVCDNCHGFDTLTWREPVEKRSPHMPAATTGAEMLPLLVGAPKPAEGETAELVEDSDPKAAEADHKAKADKKQAEEAEVVEPDYLGKPGYVQPEPDYTPKAEEKPKASAAKDQQAEKPAEHAAEKPAENSAEKPVNDAEKANSADAETPAAEAMQKPEEPREMVRPDIMPPDEADWNKSKQKR